MGLADWPACPALPCRGDLGVREAPGEACTAAGLKALLVAGGLTPWGVEGGLLGGLLGGGLLGGLPAVAAVLRLSAVEGGGLLGDSWLGGLYED